MPTVIRAGAVASAWGAITGTLSGQTDLQAALDAKLSLTGGALTGAVTNTQAIGATSTDGQALINSTAATVGAQKWSPRVRWTGQGWKTDATAASQTVDWIIENQPVQGAANPTTNLVFSSQVNAGGYTAKATITSGGQIIVPDSASNALPSFKFAGGVAGLAYNSSSDSGLINFVLAGGAYLSAHTSGFIIPAGSYYNFSSGGGGSTVIDLRLTRAAAAVLQMGADVNGAAVSQTLQAANGITGTDKAGGNMTLASGKGTGAGAVSSLIFQTPTVLTTGTTAQSLATRVTIDSTGFKQTAGFHEMVEQAAPAAGAADSVRIYAVDNGAGKTQLMALFATGVAQQIAIQP